MSLVLQSQGSETPSKYFIQPNPQLTQMNEISA